VVRRRFDFDASCHAFCHTGFNDGLLMGPRSVGRRGATDLFWYLNQP
jgi:hypothetical protein